MYDFNKEGMLTIFYKLIQCRPLKCFIRTMLNALPWTTFEDDKTHFWVHYGLCAFGFLLAVITFIVQATKPAPYGRHQKSNQSFGPMVHQRLAHTISDAIPGVLLFSLVFFLYGTHTEYTNITFYCLWLCHYVHRGIIHPWIMKYSSPKTPLGIPLGGLFPNLLYSFLNADWIGAASYDSDYYKDPRFIVGVIMFVTGISLTAMQTYHFASLEQTAVLGIPYLMDVCFTRFLVQTILEKCLNGLAGLWEHGQWQVLCGFCFLVQH